jgi:hypothetical protein
MSDPEPMILLNTKLVGVDGCLAWTLNMRVSAVLF